MKARIRNAADVVIERLARDASVADQLTFDRYPEDVKTIARRAVALEIDKAAEDEDDADSKLGDAVAAVKLHVDTLEDLLRRALACIPAGAEDSDAEVLRSKTLAELAELGDAVGELEVAAEAEPE